MPTGSCMCEKVKYSYEGEIQGKALCHCRDCQKITGSTYSTNIIVPGENFKVTSGKDKTHAKKADGGNTITSHFCGDCGSTMWRDGETFGTAKVIKAGTLDDPNSLEGAKPGIELFSPGRISWVQAVPEAAQKKDMPNSADS
ncbi:hypothetical protein LTR62_006722 [Meristemomyces frigidus]|uniref:CENP-V/GFA domain-containing protein n=1 Tax=Meristemomyces frigidus TaxID=1508187 RepID=A0AAN7TVS1_9PEZI|nr:hypothetical protein LTR62_006722 [Meristemomyces frigidus]